MRLSAQTVAPALALTRLTQRLRFLRLRARLHFLSGLAVGAARRRGGAAWLPAAAEDGLGRKARWWISILETSLAISELIVGPATRV